MKDDNFAGNSKSAIDFLGNTLVYECMGCAISKGKIKIPGGIIYEGEYTKLAGDPEIPIPGFLIVNAKRHVNSFSDLTKEERNEISEIIAFSEKVLKKLEVTNEITLVQEERSKHLHIWIFPFKPWMKEKFGKGITYFREISEYAQKNVTKEEINECLNVIEEVKKEYKNFNLGKY